MRHLHRVAVALAFIFALSSFIADAAMTINTRQRLNKFGNDLREVIQNNMMPARRAVREQLAQDLNTEFSNQIRDCNPPPKWTMQKAAAAYIGSLDDMFTMFPTEASRTERNLFMKACSDTYRHECRHTIDINAERTLQQCYDMLLRDVEEGMKRFAQERCKEARQEMQTSFNTMFGELLGSALVPDNVNLATQMADNVDRAHTLFPIHTKELADRNGPIISLLESAAKRLEQRARNYRPPAAKK